MAIDWNKPCETEDGRPVRLLGRVDNSQFPWVIALRGNGMESHKEFVEQVDHEGMRCGLSSYIRNITPKPVRREGWINITYYDSQFNGAVDRIVRNCAIWPSEKEARREAEEMGDVLATVRIRWEEPGDE